MPIGTSNGQVFENEFDWVLGHQQTSESDDSNMDTRSGTAASTAAASQKASVSPTNGRTEGNITRVLDSLGSDIKKAIQHAGEGAYKGIENLRSLVESEMGLQPGESIQDHPEIADKVAKAGTDLALLGLATAPLRPGVGLFGGRFTPTSKAYAEEMENRGFSPESIRQITGLERGMEGRWRKEIDDSRSIYFPERLTEEGNSSDVVFAHPNLYQIYPELRDVKIFKDKSLAENNYGGMYYPRTKSIGINPELSPVEIKSTIIHELQHAIQHIEGFAMGVKEEVPQNIADAVKRQYILGPGSDALRDIDSLIKQGYIETARHTATKLLSDASDEVYRRLASEVEARNSEARMNLKPEMRRHLTAQSTEDVPRNMQLLTPSDVDKIVGENFASITPSKTQLNEADLRALGLRKNTQYLDFETPDGSKGYMTVSFPPTPKNDTMHIEWIGTHHKGKGPASEMGSEVGGVFEGANAIGTKEIKTLIRDIKENYPHIKYVSGIRISGAREISGQGAKYVKLQIRD